MTGALDRRTSGYRIMEHLRQLILGGVLRDGDPIPQLQIAALYGVSRLPVREALVGLQREGLVTADSSRRAFVSGMDGYSIVDYYEFLGAVHSVAIWRAITRDDGEGLIELRSIARRKQSQSRADEFWAHVLQMARSSRLQSLSRSLPGILSHDELDQVRGTAARTAANLDKISRAMIQGDYTAAQAFCLQQFRMEGRVARQLRCAEAPPPSKPGSTVRLI